MVLIFEILIHLCITLVFWEWKILGRTWLVRLISSFISFLQLSMYNEEIILCILQTSQLWLGFYNHWIDTVICSIFLYHFLMVWQFASNQSTRWTSSNSINFRQLHIRKFLAIPRCMGTDVRGSWHFWRFLDKTYSKFGTSNGFQRTSLLSPRPTGLHTKRINASRSTED